MTGEEIAGPPGPKVVRLLYFVGAGVICTTAINKWREYERNTIMQQQIQSSEAVADAENSSDPAAVAVSKALK